MMNTKEFSLKIEALVIEKKLPYMDAVVLYCETYNVEIEAAAKLINTKIKKTIQAEAAELNMMKEKIQKLPI